MKIRLLSIISAILIIFCSTSITYADDSNDWLYIQQFASNQQSSIFLSAFKAFLNSNSTYLTFSYNQQKAIVNFTYDKLNQIQKSLGLGSIESYYNDIACACDNYGHLKFYYTASGLKFMDDLFKGLMDYYGIDVTDISKNIYQGKWWEDIHGNGCYLYEFADDYFLAKHYTFTYYENYITKVGTPYIYDTDMFISLHQNAIDNNQSNFTLTFNPQNNLTHNQAFYVTQNSNGLIYIAPQNENKYIMAGNNYTNKKSQILIFKRRDYNQYSIGALCEYTEKSSGVNYFIFQRIVSINSSISDDLKNQLINLAKEGANAVLPAVGKSAAIDVGEYGNDALTSAIDHLKDNTKKKPDIDPVDDPVNPPSVNPPAPSIPVGIVNNMPINIQLPDLDDLIPDPIQHIPNGFTIPGLRYKFPFCIPFDMIAIYEVLDQTPQAPYFETEINFASFNYDLIIDLQEYNPYMVHIRNYFLILYIFGLLFITPKLLKA